MTKVIGRPRDALVWTGLNMVLAQLWLMVASIGLVTIFATDISLLSTAFVQGYWDMTVLGAVGYVPYLALIYLLPRRWSLRRRRLLAILASPLAGLWLFLPHLTISALLYGAMVILPIRPAVK